jgi:hypothetical protein
MAQLTPNTQEETLGAGSHFQKADPELDQRGDNIPYKILFRSFAIP